MAAVEIRRWCDACGHRATLPLSGAGKPQSCPRCGKGILVPWQASQPSATQLPLETDRLALRRFHADDRRDVAAYASREEVLRYQHFEPYSGGDVAGWIAAQQEIVPGEEGTWLQLAIVPRSLGQVVGDCGILIHSLADRQGEINFTLNPDFQGQGYATEAARGLLRIGFEQWNLHRITAVCDARNAGSVRLLERLGMRLEGCFRHEFFVNGEWIDDEVHAILEDECP